MMWLILSASALPITFLFNFLLPGVSSGLFLFISLAGYGICFALHFLFWCMAVYLYDGQVRGKVKSSYGDAYGHMRSWAWPTSLTGLVCGLISMAAFMASQIAIGFILSFLIAGQQGTGSLFALSLVYFYLSYLAADLAIVFIVLVPQMLSLERGRKVEDVLRASFNLVKERYKQALALFIIPEIVIRTLFLGASFAIRYVSSAGLVFALFLLSMTLLEGGKTAFVAAAFNRFYYRVLEEEKKKRKAKSKRKPSKKQTKKKR